MTNELLQTSIEAEKWKWVLDIVFFNWTTTHYLQVMDHSCRFIISGHEFLFARLVFAYSPLCLSMILIGSYCEGY
jgi:hypothetical protein